MYESEAKEYGVNLKEIEEILEIMAQEDQRYIDFYNAIRVSSFVKNKGIKIVKFFKQVISLNARLEVNGPQKVYKKAIITYLESRGYKLVGIEKKYLGGIVDVIMQKEDKIMLIECGPCRIDKAINYLIEKGVELLIVDKNTDDKNIIAYKFKRGKNWNKVWNNYKEKEFNEVQNSYEEVLKTFNQC